ncbi:MAG: DNA methyltransferase [Candidatus Hodarchaeota archaeon]
MMDDVHFKDCVQGMKELESKTVDLVIADPPYNLNKGYRMAGDNMSPGEYINFCKAWLEQASRVLKPNGCIYVICSTSYHASVFQVMEGELGMHYVNTIIWVHKENPHVEGSNLAFHYDVILLLAKARKYYMNVAAARNYSRSRKGTLGNVWTDIPPLPFNHHERWVSPKDEQGISKIHASQKPRKLFKRMILLSSRKGDTVLDPFVGTGTTPACCLLLDRKFVGFEVNVDLKPAIEFQLTSAEATRSEGLNRFPFKKRILSALENGPAKVKELAFSMGEGNREKIRKYLSRMKRDGIVEAASKDGKETVWKILDLPP